MKCKWLVSTRKDGCIAGDDVNGNSSYRGRHIRQVVTCARNKSIEGGYERKKVIKVLDNDYCFCVEGSMEVEKVAGRSEREVLPAMYTQNTQ